jgi:hypothetical protein
MTMAIHLSIMPSETQHVQYQAPRGEVREISFPELEVVKALLCPLFPGEIERVEVRSGVLVLVVKPTSFEHDVCYVWDIWKQENMVVTRMIEIPVSWPVGESSGPN